MEQSKASFFGFERSFLFESCCMDALNAGRAALACILEWCIKKSCSPARTTAIFGRNKIDKVAVVPKMVEKLVSAATTSGRSPIRCTTGTGHTDDGDPREKVHRRVWHIRENFRNGSMPASNPNSTELAKQNKEPSNFKLLICGELARMIGSVRCRRIQTTRANVNIIPN